MKRFTLVILLLVAAVTALNPNGPQPGLAAFPLTISGGSTFTCAVIDDGTARCWGDNDRGQLGDGTTGRHLTPTTVSGLLGAVAISAGSEHACALLDDATVKCWGLNAWGELGDGTTMESHTPVAVSGLSNATAILAAGEHSCALLSDGSVRCWGYNSEGELGDGTTTTRTSPVAVSGIENAISIGGGEHHTCAVLDDGTAKCWGSNSFGQLGDGTYTDRTAPVAVSGLNNVIAIAPGNSYAHTCALLSDATAACWGYNHYGQLGDGTTTTRTAPVAVSDLSNAVTVTTGWEHSCALLSNGTAKCWGMGSCLGIGPSGNQTTPVSVLNLSDAFALDAGWSHVCALTNYGGAKCWGYNSSGQLGDGTTEDRGTPVDVVDFPVCMSPLNDYFAGRTGIGALPFAAAQSTMCVGLEINEPRSCASMGSTVWYSYTPSVTGIVQADTAGSDYDTALAVYTGSYLGNLSSVVCDDDSGPGLTSLATFAATAGTTYHFQLGGFGGSKGDLRFELVAPTPTPTPVDTATPTITPTPCPPNACTPTPTPSPSPTGAWPAPKVSIDETVNGDQGPVTVNIGDSVTFHWVVSNTGTQMVTAQIVNDTQHGLDSTCSQLWPGGTCENSLQVTLSISGPVVNTSNLRACDMKGNCTSAQDYVKVNVVDPLATSVPPVGGIAEVPAPDASVRENQGLAWLIPIVFVGVLASGTMLLLAGSWYARRRRRAS